MRIITKAAILALCFWPGCASDRTKVENSQTTFLAKEMLNSNWQNQAIGDEEWYYRMTVVDAPANTEAMGIGEGHYLHPELIRFEITKDMLIGHSTFSSVINAEHEQNLGKGNFRGAPVVAFPITAHFDLAKGQDGQYVKSGQRPWQKRQYIDVDWSRNLISPPKRSDGEEEGPLTSMVSYMVDGQNIDDPRRMRIGKDFIDITARYPTQMSVKALKGHYGQAYKEDSSAPVIDIRHFLLKKSASDFVPLPHPDFVIEEDEQGPVLVDGKPKKIPINRRFGLFRTNLEGRLVHDNHKGTSEESSINATIFNIWQKSRDENGAIIPIAKREIKPIIYYMNVLHPEDLKESSANVAKQWDKALREMVFHAQPNRYESVDQVPSMWILRPNSCNIEQVSSWLKDPVLLNRVEDAAKMSLEQVKADLEQALLIKKLSFSKGQNLENKAKRHLEKLCTALEFYTEQAEEKFIYQRPGDLRFNLLNLEMGNNTTGWSGYGPMLADPISGETISATANINLKYIDLAAQKMAKQIGLLKEKSPGLMAVFGSGINQKEEAERPIDEQALRSAEERVAEASLSAAILPSTDLFRAENQSVSLNEVMALQSAEKLLAKDEVVDPKKGMMDPLKYVDNISLGIALKYADLKESERFLKIRDLIYQSVALHELGHNLGLKHNMAGASDVLNYGKKFWRVEGMPNDIEAALKVVRDPETKLELTRCLEEQKKYQVSFLNMGRKVTTKDCLQQKNGMYSSIMDYHATSLADIEGLGAYDKAAIKWAYGHLLEVFPEENVMLDTNKIEIARWLRLNNYRHIPRLMVKGVNAINERQYTTLAWDRDKTLGQVPKNAVPYAYCDDPSGRQGPRCLAYDFGPDMKSSALWLREKFWQQYLLNHFAKDQTWSDNGASVIADDIDNLKRFTNMLRWYYKTAKEDPEFKGSYLEKDYLLALGIGMNHFAHVLGMPEAGAHISAPAWKIEDQLALPLNTDRTAAAKVLIPAKLLSACDAKAVTSLDKNGQISGRFNFKFAEVPLGLGRPLISGLSDSLENKTVVYSGSSLVKKYALYLLVAPLSSSRSPGLLEKSDLLSMTWYRMFPKAVSKIYASVIGGEYQELGPVLNGNGTMLARDIINTRSHKLLSYQDASSIMPAMESSLPLFAAEAAITFIPETIAQEENLLKSLSISCKGCRDEVDYAPENESSLVRYHHIFGQEYSAVSQPETSSIGAELLKKAIAQKERYLRLKECLSDEKALREDPFCQCIKTTERKSFADWICCDETNENCLGPTLEKIGEGICTTEDIEKRLSQSLSQLEETVGFIDSLRALMGSSQT